MKYIFLIIGVLLVAIVGYFLFRNTTELRVQNDKIQVAASFYPLSEFAKAVGGDKINVMNLTPAGSEPHDFDPSPRDLASLQNSKVFIYNGAGFEPWVERILPDIQKSGVFVVDSTSGVDLLAASEEEEKDSLYDPHVWLDPVLAMAQVDNIYTGLIKADPENKDYYEKNISDYKARLEELDREFESGLANCQSRDVVVSHNAYAYLAKRYNFNIVPISGLSPDEEPSPQKMADIVKFAKVNNVNYIFFETLVSPRLSETIAKEIGAETLVLNPIEGLTEEEIVQGLDYISVSMQNLNNLRLALNCK